VLAESPMAGFSDLFDPEVLRAQGIDLYDRAITEGKPQLLLEFIEEQLGYRPPRIAVLREVSEHLHQRLVMLRDQYFEARERVLYIIHKRFAIDLSPLYDVKLEAYHQVPIDDLINAIFEQQALRPETELRLRRILKISHAIAAQVYADIQLTEHIHTALNDWLAAIASQSARRITGEGRRGEHIQ
jgi:hypothetical protein